MKRLTGIRGFTLIELLVVVAIIALLISILLPSLGKARASARATRCGASMRAIGQAVAGYLAENADVFPPSYVYPDANGSWNLHNQQHPPVNGYQHWSSFLFGNIKDLKAFTCPEFERGGVPRTNPGPNGAYWMDGQVDQNGSTTPNSAVEDRQAPYCAFVANEAIMPRNKFDATALSSDPSTAGGVRLNVCVKRTNVVRESSTILATEFNADWHATATDQGSGGPYKAVGHRPIMPFGLLTGNNEFEVPLTAFFTNVSAGSLMSVSAMNDALGQGRNLIADKIQLNDVGRNHPGSTSANGTSNFIYVDGHVERKYVSETLNNKEWGSRFYSINGDSSVR